MAKSRVFSPLADGGGSVGSISTSALGSGSASSTTYLAGDRVWRAISATPGGADTNVQYNSSGSFAGDSAFTYSGSALALTGSGSALTINRSAAALTTSLPVLNATQAWNAVGTTFTAALINVTDTASAAASKLFDAQLGGVSRLNINKSGLTAINGPTIAGNGEILTLTTSLGTASLRVGSGNQLIVGGDVAAVGGVSLVSSSAHLKFGTGSDAGILYTAAGALKVTNGSSGYGVLEAANFSSPVFTITDSGSPAVDINPANGAIQVWTLGANRTPTASSFTAGQSVTLMIADGASAFSVNWTTIGVSWVNGNIPALPTSGFGVVELWKAGTTVYGAWVGTVS